MRDPDIGTDDIYIEMIPLYSRVKIPDTECPVE